MKWRMAERNGSSELKMMNNLSLQQCAMACGDADKSLWWRVATWISFLSWQAERWISLRLFSQRKYCRNMEDSDGYCLMFKRCFILDPA